MFVCHDEMFRLRRREKQPQSLLGNAANAVDAQTKGDNGRGFRIPCQFGLYWCQFRESLQQLPQNRISISRVGNLFIRAKRNRAAPMKIILDAIYLQARALMRTHRRDFATGQRVAIAKSLVDEIIDRNHVWLISINAGQMTKLALPKHVPRFIVTESSRHCENKNGNVYAI